MTIARPPFSASHSVGLGKYFKSAFLYHWNLLALLGTAGFAVLSFPGAFLPVVAAAEIAYLGLLGTHPKYQRYVDAQAAKAARSASSLSNQQDLERITKSLPKDSLARFEKLRAQCVELRQIASELHHPGTGVLDATLDSFQMSGLDRLLWIYLRLLYTQFALARFLQRTNRDQIQQDITVLEKKVGEAPSGSDNQQAQRVHKALQDNLETSRNRLVNWNKAMNNYELVKLELDRLENKIRSLSEMAVNRQEPDFISGQVDQVASSMVETERTMNDLQFATGLETMQDEPPELLRARVVH
jgi:hypothetical protein